MRAHIHVQLPDLLCCLPFVLQGAQHSAQIFSMAMLLSSIFIYNQVGAIDAIAIERLAMVCELAKRIKDRSTVGEWRPCCAPKHQLHAPGWQLK